MRDASCGSTLLAIAESRGKRGIEIERHGELAQQF